jgi:metal-responsive CopG/Arc/MetJ family transcriptional regulator
MKHNLSITLEEDLVLKIIEKSKEHRFRNRSHFVECALREYLEGK